MDITNIQRKLKFRVWNVVDNKYTYYPNRQFLIGLDGGLFDGNGCLYEEKHITQQFTGFYDQDGKEIYDGDIVEWPESTGFNKKSVIWDAEQGFWGISGESYDGFDLALSMNGGYWNGPIRVVSNIFENPELLK